MSRTDRRTDGRTERRLAVTIPHAAYHRTVKINLENDFLIKYTRCTAQLNTNAAAF